MTIIPIILGCIIMFVCIVFGMVVMVLHMADMREIQRQEHVRKIALLGARMKYPEHHNPDGTIKSVDW